MSQYDFGVIDPDVRDGAWLADALNQWRDALYTQMSGAAAPAFAVDGFLWRDTSAGAPLTVMRQRQAGAWKELWRFDAAGAVKFANTFDPTAPADITGLVHLTKTPTSLVTDGAVGIGTTAPTAGYLLHVKSAADHVGIRVEATAAGKWASLELRNAARVFTLNVNDGGAFVLNDGTAAAERLSISPAGVVTITGVGAPANYEFLKITGTAAAQITVRAATANVAGLLLGNTAREWWFQNGGDGVLRVYMGATAALTIDTGLTLYAAGPIFTYGDGNFGLVRAGTGGAPGDERRLVFYQPGQTWLSWNGADGAWRFIGSGVQRFGITPGGDGYFNGIVSAAYLTGGPGGSGLIRSFVGAPPSAGAHTFCLRYDDTNGYIYIRVDEALERRLWPQP